MQQQNSVLQHKNDPRFTDNVDSKTKDTDTFIRHTIQTRFKLSFC